MPLLVDAFNVLHVTGVLPPELAGIDLEGLAALIAASRYRAETAWLICDGRPRGRPRVHDGSIVVQHAGAGQEADDQIGRIIDRSSAPRRLIVVSSDRRVARMARRRRCRWLGSDAFLAQLVADWRRSGTRRRSESRPRGGLGRPEVARWLATFGLDEATMAIEPAGVPDDDAPVGTDAAHGAAATGEEPVDSLLVDPTAPGAGAIDRLPLAGVRSIDEIDLDALESMDLGAWLDHHPPPPPRARRQEERRGR